jgi:4-amino-4-deoxychorismate lyase
MSRFIESIKILNGVPQHLHYHNERFNRTLKDFYGISSNLDLGDVLKRQKQQIGLGLVKATIEYDKKIQEIRFQNYTLRKIKNLRLIEAGDLDYSYKFANRSQLNELLNKRGDFDEIIIFKNNYLTDSSYSNLAFYDGNQWFTPLHPLLKGTCRQRLINENKIIEAPIKIDDFKKYQICSLINAMLDLGELCVDVNKITHT